MLTKRIILDVELPRYRVHVGRQGEHDVTSVQIDCTEYIMRYGEGTPSLVCKNPNESTTYSVPLIREGAVVTWVVGVESTATSGRGQAVLLWYPNNGGEAKTADIEFCVEVSAVHNNAVSVIAMIEDLKEQIKQIQEDGIDNEAIERLISEYLAEHPIEGVTADAVKLMLADYVKTGDLNAAIANYVNAHKDELKGEKGDTGETGPKGDTGERGEAGQKGDKGDKGDPFTYSDFTPEQLEALKGPKGDPGEGGSADKEQLQTLIDASLIPVNEGLLELEKTKADKLNTYTKTEVDEKVESATPTDYDEVKRTLATVAIDVMDHEGRIYRIEQEIGQMDMQNLNFEQMIEKIGSGKGKNLYPVGDQLLMNYNYNGVNYECPHNIVDHGSDIILDDEENEVEVPSMAVEWEYTIPNALVFDPVEAMYVAHESGLTSGTYHFKVDGDSWNSENGKIFQFTLTEPLTEGMHLRPTKDYNKSFANTNMCVYANGKSTTALQTAKIIEGSEGTDLGTLGSGDLNHYHRIFLGYNRWSQSLYRQWLNAEGTGWWEPQNPFDRAPSGVDTLVGYLSNIPEGLKAVLKPVKLQTYRNTVTDDGGIDVTYDKVFPLAFANWNNESSSNVQSPGNGVEGDAYEYYHKIAEGVENLNSKGNFKMWKPYPILIRYALNAKTSAQSVFSRSAFRTGGYSVLSVNTSGYVSNNYAYNGLRCRPACKICGNPPSHASAE